MAAWSELLEPGKTIGGDELLFPLNTYHRILPTWKARDSQGQEYVLRFVRVNGLANVPRRDLEPIAALPPIAGFVPWLDWTMLELKDKWPALIIRRPYFPQRLTDRFPADAAHPPPKALLDAFSQLAHTFEALQTHLPDLDFDLAPGNLLLDGDVPLLVDCGLSHHVVHTEMDNRMMIMFYAEHERQVPLTANYPSIWRIFHATKSAWEYKIDRTDAQYALAALYVYLRTRFLIFEDPTNPFPQAENLPRQEAALANFKWYSTIEAAVQAYEEKGTLRLSMLLDERERAVVARALARDHTSRYPTCSAFVMALQEV